MLRVGELELHAGLTRSDVLALALDREEAGGVLTLPMIPAEGTTFAATLWFDGERLVRAELRETHPRFGASWNDWTAEQEDARHAAHEAWLARWAATAAPGVRAVRHERGGFSHMELTFRSAAVSGADV